MSSLILHGFSPPIAAYLRGQGHRVVELAGHENADYQWSDLVTARNVAAPPLDTEGLSLLKVLLGDAATIFDLYARHFVLNQADQADFRGLLELHLRFVLKLFRSENPDACAFSAIPHEGYDFVLYLLARHLGIKCLVCHQTPFTNLFWLMENGWDFSALDREPPVTGLRSTLVLPEVDLFYMRGIAPVPSYKLWDAVRDSVRRPPAIPAFMFRWQRAAIYRHRLRRSLGNREDSNRPFVYFPLHLQPELTTSVLGGVFTDQVLAVEWLREVIPQDMSIVVKENPRQTEMHRGRLFFDRLNRIPAVTMVDAGTPTRDLIARCEAIATVSGTAGWEGLLAGKPVLLFGRAWYEGFSGVHGMDAIVPHQMPATPDRDVLQQDFSRRLSRANEGVADEGYLPITPHFDAQENAIKVGQVLLCKVQGR